MQLDELHCFFLFLLAVVTLLDATRTRRGVATCEESPCLAYDDRDNDNGNNGHDNTLPIHSLHK